jgi:hypothetical protein
MANLGLPGLTIRIQMPQMNAKFGDKLIKQALEKDKIKGEKGAAGTKEYLKNKPGG